MERVDGGLPSCTAVARGVLSCGADDADRVDGKGSQYVACGHAVLHANVQPIIRVRGVGRVHDAEG